MPSFLFVTCQAGAERAVKAELARRWPDFRLAFSRKGFLTFKLPEEHTWPPTSTWSRSSHGRTASRWAK